MTSKGFVAANAACPYSIRLTPTGYTRPPPAPPTLRDERSIQNITLAVYKIRVLQGQPPKGRAARCHPRLQGTSILMGQPWPWAVAISTPSAQVPKCGKCPSARSPGSPF